MPAIDTHTAINVACEAMEHLLDQIENYSSCDEEFYELYNDLREAYQTYYVAHRQRWNSKERKAI